MLYLILILLCKSAGLVISTIISLDKPGFRDMSAKGKTHGKSDCRKVLDSKVAVVFGIHMAELGVVYFGGGLLVTVACILSYSSSAMFILALLSLLTLPYTVFSVIYQGVVVRSWCVLCLRTLLLFWLEFFLLQPFLTYRPGIWNLKEAVLPAVSFMVAAAAWIIIRRRIKK
ncbi:MAG: vitamin K epoxide reductase family protein [bacterium]|nr:vitamin K epoxide reductase family protein [bacterium]